MRRRALLMGGKKPELPLIIRVDTTKSGTTPSDSFLIPTNAPYESYEFNVDWGDGVVTSNHTGNAEHTYLSGGVYDIQIYGKFPRIYFNNGGDRRKLLEVLDWGTINYSPNQTNAFYGCNNLTFIATDAKAWYNGITSGGFMFGSCSLASLPNNMTLNNLTNGSYMFNGNSLTSLPDGMLLSSLTAGTYMFQNNSLTTLPDGMELNNVTNGTSMFRSNSLTSLPNSMTLDNLLNGTYMFYDSTLTSLPTGLTLSSLSNGNRMFWGNPITSAIGLELHSINNGTLFMNEASLPVNQYSNILIDIEANNPYNNVTIDFGDSQYSRDAAAAREELVLRGWSITDGGVE